jgi:GT2 family glycosyltransferase
MVAGISVVIPNFNGEGLFPGTIPTIMDALNNSKLPHEIIVVDDCSTDNSVAYLSSAYPAIRILRNSVNSGFSVTVNNGVRQARYDKVLILNSDVKLTPFYFIRLCEKYFEKKETFGVMGRIIGWEDEIIQDGAKYPVFQGAKIKTSTNYLLEDTGLMNDGVYTMYLSGANAFVDKEKFIEIGGFNEMFSPFYVEDYELSIRAWRLGYRCYFDYQSICRHKTSTTIKTKSKKEYVDIIYNRNKFFLHALHLQGGMKWLWYLQLSLEVIFSLLFFKWNFLRALKLFLQSIKKIKQSREDFNKLAEKRKVNKSIVEVAVFIKNDLKGKQIIKF